MNKFTLQICFTFSIVAIIILPSQTFSYERDDTLSAVSASKVHQTINGIYKDSFAQFKLKPSEQNILRLYKNNDKLANLKLFSINLDSGKDDSSRLKLDTGKVLTKEQKEYKGYESKSHLLISLAEMALIEYIPFAMAKYLRNWDESGEVNWTKVSWETWRKNLREGFEYDGDNFTTNYFSHPYHGNLYYNAGRANGYDFWNSSIYAFIGSGIWETFGETFRPSFNDLVNTTVNGINFGETLFRLSAMVTDNRASGFERVWREALGGLINPVREVNRILSGEAFKKFDNPYYGKQPKFLVKLSAGMRRLDNSNQNQGEFFTKGIEEGIYSIDVQYGDLFSTIAPFSYFNFGAELTTGSPSFARLYSAGHIYGFTVNDSKDVQQKLNISLDYTYTNNPGFQYGQTAVIPNFLTRVKLGKARLLAQIGINAILMAGTNTDYYIDQEGRNYDMGPGIGTIGDLEISYKNWTYFKLYYTNAWIFSMTEPQESTHNLNYIQLSLALPFKEYFAVGLDMSVFWRNSYYNGSPDVKRQVPIAKLYFSTYL